MMSDIREAYELIQSLLEEKDNDDQPLIQTCNSKFCLYKIYMKNTSKSSSNFNHSVFWLLKGARVFKNQDGFFKFSPLMFLQFCDDFKLQDNDLPEKLKEKVKKMIKEGAFK